MKKFWTGVLAFAPIVTLIGCFLIPVLVLLMLFVLGMMKAPEEFTNLLAVLFMLSIWVCIFAFIAVDIADMIVFSIFAFKNQQIDITYRSLWCGAFLTFQMMAFPVYWWIYMRKPAINSANVPNYNANYNNVQNYK